MRPQSIITLPPVKGPLLLSSNCFKTVFTCEHCLICAYFSRNSDETTFSTAESNFPESQKCFNDGFVSYKKKKLCFRRVAWIIVIFLSAVWTLILTAPIHSSGSVVSKWCNAKSMGYIDLNWLKLKIVLHVKLSYDSRIYRIYHMSRVDNLYFMISIILSLGVFCNTL